MMASIIVLLLIGLDDMMAMFRLDKLFTKKSELRIEFPRKEVLVEKRRRCFEMMAQRSVSDLWGAIVVGITEPNRHQKKMNKLHEDLNDNKIICFQAVRRSESDFRKICLIAKEYKLVFEFGFFGHRCSCAKDFDQSRILFDLYISSKKDLLSDKKSSMGLNGEASRVFDYDKVFDMHYFYVEGSEA